MLTAWAAATVVIRLAEVDLHPKAALTTARGDVAAKAPKVRRAADDAIIFKRNLFGAADLDVASDDGGPAVGGADLRLRGIAASQGASFAVFENTTSGEQNVFGIGERIFDGPKLVSVDPEGADVLLRGRKRRYLIEEEDQATAATGDTVEKADGRGKRRDKAGRAGRGRAGKVEKAGKDGKGKDAGTGVRKTGESSYLVDRREVEHVVANLNEVITQARAVPVMNEGKSAGFKLFNIRRGSIFEKLGLVDGDVVQRVNDTELTDPSKAVGLLEEIQSMGQVKVNFVRSGKPHSYTYTIR